MDERVTQYVKQKIEGSVLVTDPFRCVYINNIFPDDFYKHIESIFPADEYLTTNSQKQYKTLDFVLKERKTLSMFNRMNGYDDLKGFPFVKESVELRRWFAFSLIPIVADKLQIQLGECDDDTRYVVDLPGYMKRPHTDVSQKLFSVLIYMSNSKCGTTILRPKERGLTDSRGIDHRYDQFEEVFDPPFVPNTLIAFERSDVSFHCVKKLGPNEYRKAIHINIRR